MFYRQMLNQGLYRDAVGAPAGAPAGAVTAPGSAAGSAGGGAPGGAPPPPSGEAGGFDWSKAGLSTESLAMVTDRKWKGVDDAITSYRHLEKMVGVPHDRIIKIPGEKDGPEAWTQMYDRLGRPKDASGYQIPLPEGDKGEFAKAMAPLFHKAGLTQSQVQTLATEYNTMLAAEQTKQTEAAKLAHQAEMSQLQQEWGAKWQQNNDAVDKAAEAFGFTKDQLLGLKNAMGPRAAMNFLLNIASKIAVEGAFHTGNPDAGFAAMTPAVAQAKIAELKKDKAFVQRFSSADPEVRTRARDEIQRLHQIAFPGEGGQMGA